MVHDSIRIMCPNAVCKRVLAVPVSARGKTVRCRFCATNIRIPSKAVAPKAAPAPVDEEPQDESQETAA